MKQGAEGRAAIQRDAPPSEAERIRARSTGGLSCKRESQRSCASRAEKRLWALFGWTDTSATVVGIGVG
jgi:hypothetical protein